MTSYQVFHEQQTEVTPTASDYVPIWDATTSRNAEATVGNIRGGGIVAIPDAATYTVLAANSGMIHVLPNLTADTVISLPTAAANLVYEFWYGGAAADAQDWQIDTGSDTNFFIGGVTHLDADAGTGADEVIPVYADGDSNSKLNILVPEVGTKVQLVCDGTNWYLNGISVAATAPTFADQ